MNTLLLFLVVVPLILFVLFSVYYENKLKNITLEYNKSQEKLKEATGNIVVGQLNETIIAKESALKDKEILESRYYDLKIENEDLKREKEKLQIELDSLRNELEAKKNNFNKLQSQFQQVQNSLIKANEDLSRLTARINELCYNFKATCGSDEKCQ